jgi:RNA polymerase sigma-70 factor (ECF subfamily)
MFASCVLFWEEAQVTPHLSNLALKKEESRIVRAAQRGDPDAFQCLYARYKNYVYSLCMRTCKDPVLAEDLSQDIFLHVWKKMASFRGQSLFRTWLYRVKVNMVLLYFRKQRIGTLSLDDKTLQVAETVFLRDISPIHLDDCVSLRNMLSLLSPRHRRVLVLHDVEGYRHQDISHLLGITSGASRSQLHKARTKMRLALGVGDLHRRQDTALRVA